MDDHRAAERFVSSGTGITVQGHWEEIVMPAQTCALVNVLAWSNRNNDRRLLLEE